MSDFQQQTPVQAQNVDSSERNQAPQNSHAFNLPNSSEQLRAQNVQVSGAGLAPQFSQTAHVGPMRQFEMTQIPQSRDPATHQLQNTIQQPHTLPLPPQPNQNSSASNLAGPVPIQTYQIQGHPLLSETINDRQHVQPPIQAPNSASAISFQQQQQQRVGGQENSAGQSHYSFYPGQQFGRTSEAAQVVESQEMVLEDANASQIISQGQRIQMRNQNRIREGNFGHIRNNLQNIHNNEAHILSESDMLSQYQTENDLARNESHTFVVSDIHKREGEHSDLASRRVQPHSNSQFTSAIAPQEREQIDAKYATDCIQEVPESARSRDFNQNTERPMMNFPTENGKNEEEEAKKYGRMSKEQVDAEIAKYDREHCEHSEKNSDTFKKYCDATCYDERVAIQQSYIQRHTPYGERVKTRDILMMKKLPRLKEYLYPQMKLNDIDMQQRFDFADIKKYMANEVTNWRRKDDKGNKKKPYITSIQLKNNRILVQVDKDSLERCEAYEDKWPLLSARKGIWKILIYINLIADKIISTKTFENISIFVILMNSLVMMTEDPADSDPPEYYAIIDNIFLGLYSVEMVLKILGLGLIFGERAYLKNSWNILDFVIVLSGYITLFTENQNKDMDAGELEIGAQKDESAIDLAGLRVFRVIRPLKTISSVKGLKVLMQALISSIPLLKDTIIILLFFFTVYSIAGTQLMTGNLKFRCVSIQEGRHHPDDLICGGAHECPGGYFCGKSNDNPNFGVSNFDNAMYSLLVVFQSVTLEGWSEVQRMMQQAYTIYIFMYFLPLVFIGAFFLLNLTLAVINSSFTEAHNEHQQREAKEKASNTAFNDDDKAQDEDAQIRQMKDEMSLTQYIAAQRAAKKMIHFLRERQKEAKEEEEKRQKELDEIMPPQFGLKSLFSFGKNKVNPQEIQRKKTMIEKEKDLAERTIENDKKAKAARKQAQKEALQAQNEQLQDSQKHKNENLTLETDKDIEDQQSQNNQKIIEIKQQKRANIDEKMQQFENEKIVSKFEDVTTVMPRLKGKNPLPPLKMKGNQLGIKRQFAAPAKNFKEDIKNGKTAISEKQIIELEFDFLIHNENDTVLNGGALKNGIKESEMNIAGQNAAHFDDSDIIEEQEQEQNSKVNDEKTKKKEKCKSKKHKKDQQYDLPKIKKKGITPVLDTQLDLDTSDSEVNEAMERLKNTQKEQLAQSNNQSEIAKLNDEQIREIKLLRTQKDIQNRMKVFMTNADMLLYNDKNVSKTFKKLLNTQRMISSRRVIRASFGGADSKAARRRNLKGFEIDQDINEEIEKKFQKKVGTLPITQKCDQQFAEIFGDRKDKWKGGMKPGQPETIPKAPPQWPFEGIEKYKHIKKVQIKENKPYFGTSTADIMEARYMQTHNAAAKADSHIYVCLQKDDQWYDREQMQMSRYMRSLYEPYQQKIFFEIKADSSDPDDPPNIEDILHDLDQPFDTVAQVNYKKELKAAPLKLFARRSDFLAMSTIQMSLKPIDKREIAKVQISSMNRSQIYDYINERNNFKQLCIDLDQKTKFMKEKDKDYRDNYFRSFLHKQEFKTAALNKFKEKIQELNNNRKPPEKVDPEKRRAELIKWQQNKRAVENKQAQKFDIHNVQELLEGNFHEMDELEVPEKVKTENNKEGKGKVIDEIPKALRQEFDIPSPDKMDGFQPDFINIKKHDMQIKKRRPMWSGQDVLPDKLDYATSVNVVEKLNNIRVWPYHNVYDSWKRFRAVLRIIVRSWFFDNFLTFAVLLNTITLSLNHYGIKPEMEELLDQFNDWFTQIFICEMAFKVFAMGVYKYCTDVMNLLDGSVVTISIFEIIYTSAASGNMDLKAFSTIRMFRTFRVFRIARLLRGLESMQTIIGVIARSYQSFIYITLLMTVFIFIFSLLGMQLFGGKFNYPDGLPRGNYDSFSIAAITVFQILTMENWIAVLFDSLRGDLNKFLVCVYYVSWIFLGNFILLNLFLAILLDSFLEEEDEEQIDQAGRDEALRLKQERKRQKLRRKQKNIVIMGSNKLEIGNDDEKKYSSAEDLEDMDEDQITNIFKDEGMMQKEQEDLDKEKLKMYTGVDCQMSFYIFDKEFEFRKLCYKAIKQKLWDNIVMLLIFLSSLKLCFDSYYLNADPDLPIMKASDNVDMFFNICFIFEMVIKQIAIGFVMDEGSYLQESWNQLDFFIVMSSIMDMSLSHLKIAMIKILRLLRTLRPLRVISHNKDLKMIVVALMESVGGIFNVMVVVFVVWLIFAIMGVNFFGGKFQYCSIDIYVLRTQLDCEFAGGEWQTYDQNFDDALKAMNVLFIVSSLEGWPDIMLQAVDATDVELGPQIEASVGQSTFFVIFILIGSFFFLNFFIGVLFLKYNQAQKQEKKGFSKDDLSWIDIQRLILATEPEYESTNVPDNPKRKKFHLLVTSYQFDVIIMGCIILNMIQMAMSYETITETLVQILKVSNYIFSAIFFIEAVLKLIAFGKSYFRNSWNKFDFFVVVSSIFDVVLEIMGSSMSWLSAGPQIARVMRVLRVTRVLRLFGKAKGLQAIIQTILFSIPSILNVTMLLMLIFFMFSILGVFMFGEVTEGEVLDDLKNFNNFFNAFLLLFAVSTGEDWNLIMFDCGRTPPDCIPGQTCGSSFSKLYFYSLVLVCSHVMLNLFILVIIQQFELYYLPKENMIVKFKQDLKSFMEVWIKFTQKKYRCQKIKEKMLLDFFQELGDKHEGDQDQSLGFRKDLYGEAEIKKNLLKMGIRNENGFIYFNELLYRAMRRKYGNFKVNKNMQVTELRTQYSIYLKTQTEIHGGIRQIKNEDIFNTIIKKESGVNPFLTMMNFKISFRTWLRHANIKIKKAAYTLLRQEDQYIEEKPVIFEVEIDNEELMSATSEEEEEEKQSSINNFKNIKQQTSTRNEKSKTNAFEMLEKGLQKKFQKQRKLNKLEELLNKNSSAKAKLGKALMGGQAGSKNILAGMMNKNQASSSVVGGDQSAAQQTPKLPF